MQMKNVDQSFGNGRYETALIDSWKGHGMAAESARNGSCWPAVKIQLSISDRQIQ